VLGNVTQMVRDLILSSFIFSLPMAEASLATSISRPDGASRRMLLQSRRAAAARRTARLRVAVQPQKKSLT
jgi:hypothetical protein